MSVKFRIRNEGEVVDVYLLQGFDGINFMAGNYVIVTLMEDGTLHCPKYIKTPGIQTDADGRIVCSPPLGVSRKAVLEEVLAAWKSPAGLLFIDWLRDQIAACGR